MVPGSQAGLGALEDEFSDSPQRRSARGISVDQPIARGNLSEFPSLGTANARTAVDGYLAEVAALADRISGAQQPPRVAAD
ncbi:hypothetical protein ACVJGD_008520 [Bradyrhizobium sp. USDA 10063]